MTYAYISLDRSDQLARLTLNRPPLNVLHIPMLRELCAALADVAADQSLKVLLLTGVGRAFCAGVDVADHADDRVCEMLDVFHTVIRQLMGLDLPVVAAVNGPALGGGWELALACDIVLAREDARIGQPEIQLGVFPPVAAALLPRLVGRQWAMDLILTGRVLAASEGQRLGMVTQTFPADDFDVGVAAFVGLLTVLSRPVLRLARRAVRAGDELGFEAALAQTEALYLHDLMRLDDPHEGLAAFAEKRAPRWKDR